MPVIITKDSCDVEDAICEVVNITQASKVIVQGGNAEIFFNGLKLGIASPTFKIDVAGTYSICIPAGCNQKSVTVWLEPIITVENSSGSSINSVLLPDICATVDGVAMYVQPLVSIEPTSGNVVSTIYFDIRGVPLTGTVDVADDCDCECTSCSEEPIIGFDLSQLEFRQETVYGFDTTNFSSPLFVGVIAPDGWTNQQFVDELNSMSGGATSDNVGSGIDYTSTVFALSPDNPDHVIVISGPTPEIITLLTTGEILQAIEL